MQIGSNTFIPGFEDQLVGIAKGETRTLKVKFPTNYGNDKLAGKDAEFETTASLIETPQTITPDDEFAKKLGLEVARQAEGCRARAHQAGVRRSDAPAREAAAARQAR